ncbi:hypothetical protein [Salmonella phage NINP13076]|nr:hypothetical protein [Salmonella phage NINP13076]
MFGWWKRRKLKLIGTSGWRINWTDTGEKDIGRWIFYESESGRRRFESSHIPWLLSKESNLPGYSGCKVWSKGGPLPSGFEPVKVIG